MSVVTVKSTAITNRDSTPPKLTNSNLSAARVHEFVGVCAMGASDSSGSYYIFGTLPSNARVSQALFSCGQAGGSAAMDIGIYDTTANGGAVIGDGDEFAEAKDIHTAALDNSDITHSGGEDFKTANDEKMLWEVLGLSSDPNKQYDVVGKLTANNASNAISLSLKVRYTV